MHDWLVSKLGLRLKRSIGFGLMLGTTGGVFWYVLALARGAQGAFAGAALFAAILLAVAGAIAYATVFRSLPR